MGRLALRVECCEVGGCRPGHECWLVAVRALLGLAALLVGLVGLIAVCCVPAKVELARVQSVCVAAEPALSDIVAADLRAG